MQDVVVRVRPATLADVPDIAPAYIASWRAAYTPLLPSQVVAAEAAKREHHDWASAILAETSHVAVACRSEQIVGVVEASEPSGGPRDLPEIEMLYVVPRCWGTAAASALLLTATSWMVRRGWPAARLRVVEAQARARRFYEREGWRPDEQLAPAHNGLVSLVYYRRDLAQSSPRAV